MCSTPGDIHYIGGISLSTLWGYPEYSKECSYSQKKVTKKALKLRLKPWINSNIQKLMHCRDKYFKSMTKNPSTTNEYLYRKFRNRVVSEQRKGKIKYFQSYFEKNKTNMKMLWTGIKSVVNVKAKNQVLQISHLLDNGSRVDDPVKMANILNNFFVNIGPNVISLSLELKNHHWIS